MICEKIIILIDIYMYIFIEFIISGNKSYTYWFVFISSID